MRESGCAASTVARTWYVASEITDADDLYDRLRESDTKVQVRTQNQWYLEISNSLSRTTRWLLQRTDLVQPIGDAIKALRGPVRELRSALPCMLTGHHLEDFRNDCKIHEQAGLDSELAEQLATFRYIDELLPMAALVRETGASTEDVGTVYLGLAEEIDFPWLRRNVETLAAEDHWGQRAARILIARLEKARSRITSNLIAAATETTIEDAMQRFRHKNAVDLSRIRNIISEIRAAESPSLSAFIVAVDTVNEPQITEAII
tara:strand:- start:330 stop:1115 length:786 start_codon:yes stop_codon:yes gene_type:complete